ISMPCPQLTGKVVTANDDAYNTARLVSNYYSSKDKFPAVIVYSKTTEDVQNAIKWARCKKMPIRIRSGGHNHEAYSTGSGVMVIDVSEMKKVDVNTKDKTARLQPGINNKELYHTLFQQGLTHAGGTCSEVGISGLVLSGG